MGYDKKIAELFLLNFNEAYRSAKLLMMSHGRISDLIPLNGEAFKDLDPDQLEKLDAFRVRYCDLHDRLGNKTFRTILKLEEEKTGSNLDILNKIEKRQIFDSFQEWQKLRDIRNLFALDYPKTDQQKAEALNIAYVNIPKLVGMVDNVIRYIQTHFDFSMTQFPLLL